MSKKVTEEELKSITESSRKVLNITRDIGGMEVTKHSYLGILKDANAEMDSIKKDLEKKYGAVNISLEDGSYTEIKEDVEDKKD
tara:strand:- start:667 stop:918 length:252 start_codon:yes stop_codon:yes gene_type:complete